jgi:glyceraldehyde 3-phosphate dehydrogenase
VNDITDAGTLAHLLAFDSTYGKLPVAVSHTDDSILVNGGPIRALSLRDPGAIQWGDLGVDVVVESTGRFLSRDDAALHLKGRRAQGADFRAGQGRGPDRGDGDQRRRLRPGSA